MVIVVLLLINKCAQWDLLEYVSVAKILLYINIKHKFFLQNIFEAGLHWLNYNIHRKARTYRPHITGNYIKPQHTNYRNIVEKLIMEMLSETPNTGSQ